MDMQKRLITYAHQNGTRLDPADHISVPSVDRPGKTYFTELSIWNVSAWCTPKQVRRAHKKLHRDNHRLSTARPF